MEEKTITLPFSEAKQNALLGHLLINEQFYKIVSKKVLPSWFLSTRNAEVYKFINLYFEKHGKHPTVAELKNFKEINALELGERNRLSSYIDRAVVDTQQIRLESIKADLTEWLHSIILMTNLKKASELWEKQDIKQCHKILTDGIREVNNTSFDKGHDIKFSNFNDYLTIAETERSHALSTGLSILDKSILKDSTSGGLQRGDTTIFLGPVNTGKTTVLITSVGANVRAGNNVFLMSHEGRPDDIRLKILANMLNCSISQIFDLYKTPEGVARINRATELLDKHLLYIPYNKAGMTIEEVVPIIRMNQEDWISSHDGKGFDLLVSDYPAILTTDIAKRGNLQKRNVDQIIYNNYVQLALEYQFHSLLAIQTNREGSRINRHENGENRILQVESVQDSFGPIQEATNVITINRSPLAMRMSLITYGIAKSRGSETGCAVIAKSNFGSCRAHSEEMGGMSYVGTKCIEEMWDRYYPLYPNQRIPTSITSQLGV